MQYKVYKDTLVVRGFIGEDISEIIKEACEKAGVKSGYITGIGAVDKCTIGAYEVSTKQYHKNTFEGMYEIASLCGNICQQDGKAYTHLHIVIADDKGNVRAGHLNESRISATLEVFVHIVDMKIDRKYDEETGLNLMVF